MRKQYKRVILSVCFVLLLVLGLTPAASGASDVPTKPDRAQFNYAFDYAKILNSGDIEKISSVGRELEKKTTAQVIVVTVDSLGNATIEEYANKLFRTWGLGNKEKNNGVLLLVNKENMLAGKAGRLRIEVGYGLEGAIPDGVAGRIRDNYILARWDQQKYSEGVLQGYLAIGEQVAKEYNVALEGNLSPIPVERVQPKPRGLSGPLVGLIVAVLIMSLGGFSNKRRRNSRRDDDDSGGFGGMGGGSFFGGGFGGGGFGGGSGGGDFGGGSSGGGGASG